MISSDTIRTNAKVAERTEKITFTCTPELKKYLEQWANEEGRSVSNLVERIVLAAREQREEGDRQQGI